MLAGTTAGELLDQLVHETPRLGTMRRSLMLMVNQEYVDADAVLPDGAEFVMIPPVSGGAMKSRAASSRSQMLCLTRGRSSALWRPGDARGRS